MPNVNNSSIIQRNLLRTKLLGSEIAVNGCMHIRLTIVLGQNTAGAGALNIGSPHKKTSHLICYKCMHP